MGELGEPRLFPPGAARLAGRLLAAGFLLCVGIRVVVRCGRVDFPFRKAGLSATTHSPLLGKRRQRYRTQSAPESQVAVNVLC
jgi:hypothetical protein